MKHITHYLIICIALLLALPAVSESTNIKPFSTNSMQGILASRQGKPFILGLWSLSCTHCRDDLALLSKLSQQHTGLELVLIATDNIDASNDAQQTLASYRFGKTEQWIFADDFIEPLRYSIDRRWRGELPRTYLYDAKHNAQAISGKLDDVMVKQWLTTQNIK